MGVYTTTVKAICENIAGFENSTGYSEVNTVLDRAVGAIFDFSFPVYQEDYRFVLCKKILKHYYTREISADTVAQWKLWLDVRLNEIMPYYNELYKSALIEFDPMLDVDVTTTRTTKHDGTTDVTGNTTNKDTKTSEKRNTYESESNSEGENSNERSGNTWDKFSDTPQGSLQNVENGTYLTNARGITDSQTDNGSNSEKVNQTSSGTENVTDTMNRTGTSEGTTVASSTDEYLETIKGKHGGVSYSKMLMEYRKTLINIDAMIIDELRDLFIMLW